MINIVSHKINLLNPYASPFVLIPKLDLSLAIEIQQKELEEEEWYSDDEDNND